MCSPADSNDSSASMPMADQFPAHSPYAYTFNDPINFTDPTGMSPCGPGKKCRDGSGSNTKKRFRLRLPIRSTSRYSQRTRSVTLWSSSPSRASRGTLNGKPALTYTVPKKIAGLRVGETPIPSAEPATRVEISDENGVIAGHGFEAEVTDGETGDERPLYFGHGETSSGAGLGDRVTVTPQTLAGDRLRSVRSRGRAQNRLMGRLTLRLLVNRSRTYRTHTRKLFGVIPVPGGKTRRLVPEGSRHEIPQ